MFAQMVVCNKVAELEEQVKNVGKQAQHATIVSDEGNDHTFLDKSIS